MLREGWRLLWHDPTLPSLIRNTLRLAFESTAIGLLVGLPVAYWLATGSSRVRRVGRRIANAGIGVPPVGVGVYVLLLLGFNTWSGPWLEHPWNAMVLAQSLIAVPVIVALATVAIVRLPDGLIDQARAFGAGGWRLFAYVLREARVGILTAVIVALGSAIGEVGAVTVLVDPTDPQATLSMRILADETAGYQSGPYTAVAYQVEHSIVILAMLLVLGLILTLAQQGRGRSRWRPATTVTPSIASAGGGE